MFRYKVWIISARPGTEFVDTASVNNPEAHDSTELIKKQKILVVTTLKWLESSG